MSAIHRLTLGLVFALLAGGAEAQVDPLLADDTDAVEPGGWRVYGDAAARAESTRGFASRDDIERARLRLRLGVLWESTQWSLRLAGKAGAGSDSNADNRRNLDNEKSNGIGLDEALLRWQQDDDGGLQGGKSAFPFATTPLTWDSDLRPIGISADRSWSTGEFNRISLVAGAFAGDHLYHDQSRIQGAQLGWHWQEGAPFSAEVLLAGYRFDDLQRATREGLSRSNRRIGDQLLSDFRLLNLQAALTWDLDGTPLVGRLDLVRNSGAHDERDGVRGSLIHGSAQQVGGLELGFAWQRIGRDAVPAAFNADDWWFHSAARGVMPWIAYGFDQTWSLQLSGFHERLDGQHERINRILLDLRARW